MDKKRIKKTLQERKEEYFKLLKKIEDDLKEEKKYILSTIFSELVEDEEIYMNLKKNLRNKLYKEELNKKVRELLGELTSGE